MKTAYLSTPLTDADLAELSTGDLVYLDGTLVTGRDAVHERAVGRPGEPGIALPVDLRGGALYHAGPIVRELPGRGAGSRYEIVACGPTTSMRMEKYAAAFIRETGVKLLIGKGGMGAATAEACLRHKVIHTVFPGGCAVLAARQIQEVSGVEWADLGMPEALWILRVHAFGPLIVSIDTRGGNLFARGAERFAERMEAALVSV
jgi:L(+)-tartrate dehydratase beta subunit